MLLLPLALAEAFVAIAAPLALELAISPRATAERTGVAVVSGIVTCSADTLVTIDGGVVEPLNRSAAAAGTFTVDVPCTSSGTPWRAVVTSDTGVPFKPGFFATADVSAVGFDPETGTFSGVQTLVFLHLTRSAR